MNMRRKMISRFQLSTEIIFGAGSIETLSGEAAFSAARTAANVALRASGFRTAVQAGHHLKTIDSLELTVQADPRLI